MSGAPRLFDGDGIHEAAVPFCRPAVSASALDVIAGLLGTGALSGGGSHTEDCHRLLRRAVPGGAPFLTTSCTDALEMAALLLDLRPGDEVVMPSWTFPSTANAVALRGATPVFADVCPATLNVDPACVAEALTSRTRAVFCVHYAGIGCEMEALRALCDGAGIALVEDAAQAYGATWGGRPLGGFGDLAAFSFHGTKNVSCGEGGALMVNRPDLIPSAEIAWEKGTERLRYKRGEIEAYEWCALGSSFLPSELTAALLAAQLREAGAVNAARALAWNRYAALLDARPDGRGLRRLAAPPGAAHNGHIFAVRLRSSSQRDHVVDRLAAQGIDARPHYKPLHLSPAGRRYGAARRPLPVTEEAGETLLRLPLDAVISPEDQERVVGALLDAARRA